MTLNKLVLEARKGLMRGFLALLLTLMFAAAGYVVLVTGVPPEGENLAMYMLGSLNTVWIGAVTYYYGTSKEKEEISEKAIGPNIGGTS